jgi:LysM repeat protein
VVRPGDTLGDIAIRHGTTVNAIVDANRSAAHDLRVGQLLRIPDATLALPPYARAGVDVEAYRLHAGEGVFEVARRFGVDPTALARSNGIGVGASLTEGSELRIPGRLARMNALLTFVAEQVQVDARLVRAIAWVESAWRQDVVSATGAVGVMQLEPFSGEWVSRHLADRRLDIWVAQDNVLAGALLLHHLLEAHGGDVRTSLAGYYQGDASVAERGLFDDTRRYQERIVTLIGEEA